MADSIWQQVLEKVQGKGEKQGKGQYSIWVVIALIAAGIFFMYASSRPREAAPVIESGSKTAGSTYSAYKVQLEKELREGLLSIRGVKDVRVVISLESGPVYDYLQNEESIRRNTQEEDSGGGVRVIGEDTSRAQTVMNQGSGGQSAVIVREQMPRLAGVMITVKGDGGLRLLEDVTHAVSAALNIPAHRIKVLPMD